MRIRGILEQQQHDRRELTLGLPVQAAKFAAAAVGGAADDDDRIEAGRGKIADRGRGQLPKSMLDDGGVRPFDFNMLSDKQSIVGARWRSPIGASN